MLIPYLLIPNRNALAAKPLDILSRVPTYCIHRSFCFPDGFICLIIFPYFSLFPLRFVLTFTCFSLFCFFPSVSLFFLYFPFSFPYVPLIFRQVLLIFFIFPYFPFIFLFFRLFLNVLLIFLIFPYFSLFLLFFAIFP